MRESKFRRYCPITLSKSPCLTKDCLGSFPAGHGKFIYYLKTEDLRTEFIHNTYSYINNPAPKPIIAPIVFILGPPKSGKTLAAKRIAEKYDLVYLTIPIILQAILDGKEDSKSYEIIKRTLEAGNTVPEDVVIDAVKSITSRAICQTKGFCLDGYPYTALQAQALEEASILPHNIFQLDVTPDEMDSRCLSDFEATCNEGNQRLDSIQLINYRNSFYEDNISGIKSVYGEKYNNWTRIEPKTSKWLTFNLISKQIEASIQKRELYLDLKKKGRAAPANGVGISVQEINKSMSSFKDYCPVTLFLKEELVQCTKNLVEFKGKFYKMRDDAIDMFLDNPEKFIGLRELPDLPNKVTPEECSNLQFPDDLELKGYCPVTLKEGPEG